MVQRVKAPSAEPDNLSLTPTIHTAEGLTQAVLRPPHVHDG